MLYPPTLYVDVELLADRGRDPVVGITSASRKSKKKRTAEDVTTVHKKKKKMS